MSATDTMRWMGRSARSRAQAMGHSMKERTLERRLGRATDEADRLRFENDRLREEIEQSNTQSNRLLDMLEHRLAAPEAEDGKTSHKGRWLVFLMALGGGAYALVRMRSQDAGRKEWAPTGDSPIVTETSSATI